MAINEEDQIKNIKNFAFRVRKNILEMAVSAGAGSAHFGGALSITEIVSTLFAYQMKIDKKNLITGTNKLIRKIDIQSYRANTALCKKIIKWKTKVTFKKIIHKMINDELH